MSATILQCDACPNCSSDRATLLTIAGEKQRLVNAIEVRMDNGPWIPMITVEKRTTPPKEPLTEPEAG